MEEIKNIMFTEQELIDAFKGLSNPENGWIYLNGVPESNAKLVIDYMKKHQQSMKVDFYKWYSKDDNVKPIDGATILTSIWFDYWMFDIGYYIEKTDEVKFMVKNEEVKIPLSDIDTWTMIHEPEMKKII